MNVEMIIFFVRFLIFFIIILYFETEWVETRVLLDWNASDQNKATKQEFVHICIVHRLQNQQSARGC